MVYGTTARKTPDEGSRLGPQLHSRIRGEHDLALEDRPGEVGRAGGGGDLARSGPGRAEMDDDPAGEKLGAQMRDVLLMAAVQAVGDAQHGGQLLHAQALGRR